MDKLVIIGAGHAGTQLAASVRDAGHQGGISLISNEPDLPYHRPPLSKSFMQASDSPLPLLRAERFFVNKSIDLHLGAQATQLDGQARCVTLGSGERLEFDRLVLATGSTARRLTVCGAELDGVFTLRSAEDARSLREALPALKRVVVIGGGFIGLEAAAMLRSRQLEVTVLEIAPTLLGRAVSEPIARAVAEYLQSKGIVVRSDLANAGVAIERIEGRHGKVQSVCLSDGERLPASMVIVGIGAVPEVALAQTAGLVIDNGIQVDPYLRTSHPDIYAIGDCACFPQGKRGLPKRLESVQNATDQARALAATLTGTPSAYQALPWFWSDIGRLRLQIAGLCDQADDAIATHHPDGRVKSVYRLEAGTLMALETLDSTGEHMLARKFIAEGITPPPDLIRSGDTSALKAFYQACTSGAQ